MSHKFDPAKVHVLESAERRKAMQPRRFLRRLGLKRGQTFIDVGAGTGFFALPAAGIVGPGGSVFALDVSEAMLEHMRAKSPPAWLEVLASEESRLPVPDGAGDLVFTSFVLHEVEDPVAFLREMGRAAKPYAPVVILEWAKVRQAEGPPFAHRLHHHRVEALVLEAGLCFRGLEFVNPSQYWVTAFRKGVR